MSPAGSSKPRRESWYTDRRATQARSTHGKQDVCVRRRQKSLEREHSHPPPAQRPQRIRWFGTLGGTTIWAEAHVRMTSRLAFAFLGCVTRGAERAVP
eukprot:3261766-Pleurochrysis_carterae.AAC.2